MVNNNLSNKKTSKLTQPKTTQNTTLMLWDGNRQAQEYTDTHVFTTVYDQDSFEPVARLVWLKPSLLEASNDEQYSDKPNNPIQIYHYHNDHLGTPNELTNNQGEVVWLADYEAWGNTAKVVYTPIELQQIQIAKDELQPIRFQGQTIDQETGLHYNRFRYYDPDVGMFISRDPIGLMGGNNIFQYAPNPVMWIDPFGLATRPNNGKFHNFFDFTLDSNNRYSSDKVQFNRANKAFIAKMENDSTYRKDMLKRYPKLSSWLSSGNKSGSPNWGKKSKKQGLTWHHHESTNRLVLVDYQDHRDNHKLYHPNKKGGGRAIWGGGRPGRNGKLDGRTGKVKC